MFGSFVCYLCERPMSTDEVWLWAVSLSLLFWVFIISYACNAIWGS